MGLHAAAKKVTECPASERINMNKKYKFMDILQDAYRNHYAVPAFDYFNLYDAAEMIRAAEKSNTPIILMSSFPEYFTPAVWLSFVEALAEDAAVPVFTHVDHASSVDYCLRSIDAGFDSVMIDASADDLDENIRKTRIVTEYAHARGVAVESEIGRIKSGKASQENGTTAEDYLVCTADAVQLVEQTGVDFLAVGIGNQHGVYVGEPHIHFDRLKEVNDALGIPLVMHGGSGLPEEILRRSIQNGITKVNVYTDIAGAFSRELLNRLREQEYPMFMKCCDAATAAAREEMDRWIGVCMSAGKAERFAGQAGG